MCASCGRLQSGVHAHTVCALEACMPTKMPEPRRRATKLSLDRRVVAEAKELGLDVSRIAEEGLAKAVAARKSELWLEENREAIEENNRYFTEHGLPFPEFRGFE